MSALLFDARINSDQLNKDVAKVNEKIHQMTDDIKTEGSKIDSIFAKVGLGIAGYFAVDNLSNFAREMVNVRGEFQKFEAVLTNTLNGDNIRASALLTGLSEFAAKTPYQLQDITENFVKLANQGIVLTQQELVKLGDFAAVTGKPIGQLFEAIMDINNPERWKEFGARIQTEGEKVAITFRNQRVEFERTIEGAKNAIAQLGTMKGVEGTMEVISKTLQGQISNFQDAWDRMLNDMGKANEGTFSGLIVGATNLVDNYESVVSSLKVLVATLGAAKAAQIVYNAVLVEQKAVNALVIESNGFLVASDARVILWKQRLLTVQQALNKSMLANPYVLAAAGITAMVAAMMVMNREFQKAIDAKKRFDDNTSRINESYESQKQKLSQLIATLRDESEAESRRIEALGELQKMYPGIFDNLDIHSSKLADIVDKEKQATEAIQQRTLQEQANYLQTLRQRKAELERAVATENSDLSAGIYTKSSQVLRTTRDRQELEQTSKLLQDETDRYNKMLEQQKAAEEAAREESEKTIQQRIKEADSIRKLNDLKKTWQQNLESATSPGDRSKYMAELAQIESALDRMRGVAGKADETPAEKIAKDIGNKRQAYEDYYTAVKQMGKEWADTEYATLLQQGNNFEQYLRNRLAATKDNIQEILAIIQAAESAGFNLGATKEPTIKPIDTKPISTVLDTKTLGTKTFQPVLTNFEKIKKWVETIRNEISEWDMEDISKASQQTSQFFGELAFQVRDIDKNLADMLDNIGGVFNSLANITSGNILQQLAGVTGLITQMYSIAMDTSKIEDHLSKPWVEFEKWITASNRALQQYIELRDAAIGEESYRATQKVIDETQKKIDATQKKLNEMQMSWTISGEGWFNAPYNEIDRKVAALGEKIGVGMFELEGEFKEWGAAFWKTVTGVFTYDLDQILTDAQGNFSVDRINDLINQGVITDSKVIEAVDNYNQLLKDLTEAEQEKQRLLTATLAGNITDSIVEGFRNGERTIQDFADNFESMMQEALLNAMKVKMIEPQIAAWAKEFEQAMSDQILTDTERGNLKTQWDRIISASAEYLKGLEDTAGIVSGISKKPQGATGVVSSVTEETAGYLLGQLYAIREKISRNFDFNATVQMQAINNSVSYLSEIAQNTRHNAKLNTISDQLRDMNNYLKSML
jgi:hypothetical protein